MDDNYDGEFSSLAVQYNLRLKVDRLFCSIQKASYLAERENVITLRPNRLLTWVWNLSCQLYLGLQIVEICYWLCCFAILVSAPLAAELKQVKVGNSHQGFWHSDLVWWDRNTFISNSNPQSNLIMNTPVREVPLKQSTCFVQETTIHKRSFDATKWVKLHLWHEHSLV